MLPHPCAARKAVMCKHSRIERSWMRAVCVAICLLATGPAGAQSPSPDTLAAARVREIIEQVAALYARNFTAAELNEVVAFYRGPTGQKFIQKLPLITQESMVIGQRFGQSIAAELRSRIVDELRKRGHDI